MKTCIPCGLEAAIDAETCLACGEASWAAETIDLSRSVPPSAESDNAVDEAAATDNETGPKKGRKRK